MEKCTLICDMFQNMGRINQIETGIRKIDLIAIIIREGYAIFAAYRFFQAITANLDTYMLLADRNCSDVSKNFSSSTTDLQNPIDFGTFASNQVLDVLSCHIPEGDMAVF